MKRLVVCIDGTWQNLARKASMTNISKIALDVKPKAADGTQQLVYYSPGVGAEAYLGKTANSIIKGAVGQGAEEAIFAAYLFLSLNYEPGDQIYLFGFSRGAFCARSLGGLIRACGLIRRDKTHEIGAGFDLYRKDATADASVLKRREEFRLANGIDANLDPKATDLEKKSARIRYIGVFDTVVMRGVVKFTGTTTINRKYGFHNLLLGDHVESARHALALDERRNTLRPTPWTNLPELNVAKLRAQGGEGYEAKPDDVLDPKAAYQQKWFAGAHGDVGGGQDELLSLVSRRWVKYGAELQGLEFDEDLSIFPEKNHEYEFLQGEIEDISRGLLGLMGRADRVAFPELVEPSENKLSFLGEKMQDMKHIVGKMFGGGNHDVPEPHDIERMIHVSAYLRVAARRDDPDKKKRYLPGTLSPLWKVLDGMSGRQQLLNKLSAQMSHGRKTMNVPRLSDDGGGPPGSPAGAPLTSNAAENSNDKE